MSGAIQLRFHYLMWVYVVVNQSRCFLGCRRPCGGLLTVPLWLGSVVSVMSDDRQIPASVDGLNTSAWSHFHDVFFQQQSFARELYFSHIHSLPPYSSGWALHLPPPTDEAQQIFGAQHPDFWRRFSLILTVYFVGMKSQGGLNKPLQSFSNDFSGCCRGVGCEENIFETANQSFKTASCHSIHQSVFLTTVPPVNTLYFWVTVIMVLMMMFIINAQK